ncbi:MAG: hypothetical protein JWQ04_1657 [Pedosphaera sp.]|nr:hypothetical protein [Pedosphaera sp.]
MKLERKTTCWLAGALLLTAVAGCRSDRDQNRGGYGGYEQGTGYQERNWDHEQDWNNPGAPYEWQHPSPGPQMEK